MNTPIVTTGVVKAEVQKPAHDAKPPTSPGRADARGGEAAADRAAISARSQAAAARRQPDGGEGGGPDRLRARPAAAGPVSAPSAESLAREVSRQIVIDPVAATRAQANTNGASVIAMLQ